MNIWAFPSFYPYDHPGLRWQGIFAHRQYKGLIDNGANLEVIQPVLWHPGPPLNGLHKEWQLWAEYNYPRERVYDNITVYHPRVANMKPGRVFSKPYAERYVDAIVRFFKENNIALDRTTDIFYAQWVPDAYLVQQAAHKLGIKSAVLMIGDDVTVWPHNGKKQMEVFLETITKADGRFAVADYLAREACRLAGKDLPFNVVRRGVNYDFFKPFLATELTQLKKEFGIPENKLIILTIGSAILRKGWLDLFDALERIKNVNGDFILVGVHAGTADINLKEEAAARGLGNHFMDIGEVDPQKINRLYNTADIFCLPSHTEGIANSVAEAMATGIAVITTNVGGHPELIENHITGILVAAKQPDILYEALLSLINDSNKRAELGRNARDFIVNKWGNFAQNAALLYERLCAI